MGTPARGVAASVAFCPQCGRKLDVGTKFCPQCGASLGAAAQSPAPASGRSESIVVSTAPNDENECITEREIFGWNLQNRQEVIGHLREAEIPDGLGQAVWRGMVRGATNRRALEYDHYVKLHFARSMGLPNLPRIKQLESEYFNLPLPVAKGIFWPVFFTLMPIPALIVALSDPTGRRGGPGLLFFPFAIGWIVLGLYWVRARRRNRAAAASTCTASMTRAEAIRQEVARLF